MGKTSTQ